MSNTTFEDEVGRIQLKLGIDDVQWEQWFGNKRGLLGAVEAAHAASEAKAVEEARRDELEHIKFIDNNGQEVHIPFTQFRSTVDGLLLSWEDRLAQLSSPTPAVQTEEG